MGFKHSITLAALDAYPIRAAGGVSPDMALGVMPTRPALLVRLCDTDGCAGWGEVWANFPPRANLHKAHVIEDVVAPRLTGIDFVEPREVGELLRKALSTYFLHAGQSRVFEHVLAGLDTALWDLALRRSGQSFVEHMGLQDNRATSYASSINAADLERLIAHHAQLGQSRFKLKVGFDDAADRRLVEKAAGLCPANARIMIDANQSWDLPRATTMLKSLEEFDPLFAEEPMPADTDHADWEALADATSVPLAGGENLYGIDAFLRFADAGARFLQPDVAKWGGVTGALALSQTLPRGVRLWPHFMGTAVGQVAALSVTAAVGGTSCCEMDVNENGLRTELCGGVLDIHEGRVDLPREPGLVAPPLPARLRELRDTIRQPNR